MLNVMAWNHQEIASNDMRNADILAEMLMRLLHQQMRYLEAKTCRWLILWNDEKYYYVMGDMANSGDGGK